MNNKRNGWKKGRAIITFNNDDKIIRAGPINIPRAEDQPVIGSIRFMTKEGEIIEEYEVAIHGIKQKDSHISFNITSVIRETRSFEIPIDNMDFLHIRHRQEEFHQRFIIRGHKLRSKKPQT